MATINYPDAADIETQARYRPGVASNIFNILTGGLAGQITGTTQKAQEAARARQVLLQEEFSKRDEERAMRRQLMANALQQGVELDPNASLDQMMADFRKKQVQGEIMKTQGRIFGLGQAVGPSPYEANPQYQAAVLGGQQELARKRAEATAEEDIQRPSIEGQLRGFGITPPTGASSGELRGLLERTRMETQSKIPMEQRAEQAKAELKTLQGLNAFPSPVNIDSLTPQQAISQAEIYGRKYQQESYIGQFDRTQKAQQDAFNKFNEEASLDTPDPNKLKGLYAQLPVSLQRDPEIKRTAGVTSAPTASERKTLSGWKDTLGRATNLASSISALAGTEDLSKVSQQNFNGIKSWLRGLENKYGVEDPRLNSINTIIQQFEKVVAGTRRDLFGASLTGNELQSAKDQFGDKNSANFLPRMVQFLDDVFSKDLVAEYRDNMIAVPPGLAKSAEEARQNWLKTREQFNFGSISQPKQGLSADKMSRLEELRRKKNQ